MNKVIISILALFYFNISYANSNQVFSVRCNFSDGLVTNFDSGNPKSKGDASMPELVFDQIDLKKGSARLIGNAGTETVQALKGQDSIHLLEKTMSGNLNITTIFLKTKNNLLPVVTSRHQSIIDAPFVSHYVGLCKALN
jgi:hypothetical protein